jgi:hydrogenase maturation factor HypF (carbamoyltransferase family)
MEDHSVKAGRDINLDKSQLQTGDGSKATMQIGDASAARELAAALQQLRNIIQDAADLNKFEKQEAEANVKMIESAAQAPVVPGAQSAAGKAFDHLTGLLGKVPELAKLLDVATKAWEVVSKALPTGG